MSNELHPRREYCQTSNIRHILVGNKIGDHSNVVCHSRLKTWLHWIGQRLQDGTRNILVWELLRLILEILQHVWLISLSRWVPTWFDLIRYKSSLRHSISSLLSPKVLCSRSLHVICVNVYYTAVCVSDWTLLCWSWRCRCRGMFEGEGCQG